MHQKKKSRAGLIVILILVILLAVLFFWQRNNVKAFLLSRKHSTEELSAQLGANTQQLAEKAETISGVTVRLPSEEEKQALRDNSLTSEELIELLIGKKNAPDPVPENTEPGQDELPDVTPSQPPQIPASVPVSLPGSPVQTEPPAAETPPADPSEADRDELARLIARIYVLQEQYTAWLESERQAAIDEYLAIPEEARTAQQKFNIGLQYIALAESKEKECDAEMAAVEEAIRAVLARLGESDELVNEIQAAYEQEKATQKAYYLSQF